MIVGRGRKDRVISERVSACLGAKVGAKMLKSYR